MFASKLDISSDYKILYSAYGYNPLCFIKKNLLAHRGGEFLLIDLDNFNIKKICKLCLSKRTDLFSRNRLLTRLLRLEPRGILKIDDNNILLSFNRYIYHLKIFEKIVYSVHKFRVNMRAPLYLTRIDNLKGFSRRYCYGEYFNNSEKSEVSIYGCYGNTSSWHEVYRFKKGEINHIHSILPDPYRNRVWIFTGDFGEAASIWYTDDDFITIKKYLGGNQQYRACVAFVVPEGLIYVTDTPLESNNIYFISKDKKVEKIYELEGSSIYGGCYGDKYIISTVVEGHADGSQGRLGLLSYKRGRGIKSWYSNLIIGNLQEGFRSIGRFRKDLFPMGLMQFGTMIFPSGDNPTDKIIFYGKSLKGIDGKLVILRKVSI